MGRGQISPLIRVLTSLSQLAHRGGLTMELFFGKSTPLTLAIPATWSLLRGARVERQPMLDMAKDKSSP